MIWTFEEEIIDDRTTKYKLREQGRLLSYREVIELWIESDPFIQFFASILRQSTFEGYFWEVKPTTIHQVDEAFEFVLIGSQTFSRIQAEVSAFRRYFTPDSEVVAFHNLGKDAMLIVPAPIAAHEWYAHLGSFVRNAPQDQQLALWRTIAEEMQKALGEKTTWLSTHGLGVYWLHVRIDSRPKYYHYQAYKE